jgi:putative oxidoreductase
MKIATIVIRVLIGLLLIAASVMFFLKMAPETEAVGNFKVFQTGLIASEYLMPFAKAIELLCGVAFLIGRYVSFANIAILPVTLNILLINFYMVPEHLPIAIFMFLGNIFLIYRYWDNYKTVFTP